MKTDILIVTYNRLDLLKKSLESCFSYGNDLAQIIIVDNASSDGTFEYLSSQFGLHNQIIDFDTEVADFKYYKGAHFNRAVHVIKLNSNTGGSGGFYTGVKFFYEKSKSDWLWGMDDDAFIKENSYKNLVFAVEENSSTLAFWSNCNSDEDFSGNYKTVRNWMFVGFFVHKDLIANVGFPVSDYFIYHDDSEYAERINRFGYEIIKVKNSLIEHGDLAHRDVWSKNYFGKKFDFPKMNDWKLYYYFRNDLLKISKQDKTSFVKKKEIIKRAIKLLIIKPQKLYVVTQAIFHGLLGKAGKIRTP
ncbi:glycosyltransferase [Aeromonas salmonicida]|uniref:glycosyltransferase n=1 Tax=Aeromonas salmonicida TaxID=645 RepID=UPI000743C1FC|nr:glycosyltransferase [Aeromonas salmonicida]